MKQSELIEKLKILIGTGIRISAIEKKIGMPQNNLSGILSGKRRFPEKWQHRLTDFLNEIESPSSFPYLVSERDGQLIRMKSLGIPVDSGATFEQLVNTVIFMAGDFKGKCQELEKKLSEVPKEKDILVITVDKIKEMCPPELSGIERTMWIQDKRNEYGI